MNLRFRRLLAATAVALAATAPASRSGAGTITFTGAITGNSCTVQVNGEGTGDGAVALPVVDTAALGSNGAPDAAGTFFDISVSNCVSPTTRVVAYFEAGPTVDPLTHALISSGTSNVGVKIYEASEAAVVGAQVSPGVTTAAQALTDSGTWHFYAGYSSETDEPRAGTVITSITYSLVYL